MFDQREGSLREPEEEETAGVLEFKLFVGCFIIIDKKCHVTHYASFYILLHFSFCFGSKACSLLLFPYAFCGLVSLLTMKI